MFKNLLYVIYLVVHVPYQQSMKMEELQNTLTIVKKRLNEKDYITIFFMRICVEEEKNENYVFYPM